MKQCPACKTTYTDDSLSFCLADGTPLDSGTDEQPTVVKKAENHPLRVEIPSAAPKSMVMPSSGRSTNASFAKWVKIAVAIVVLIFFAIGAAGLIGAVFYYQTGKQTEVSAKSPTPTATPTPTPDAEKERLRDELANIQKKLEDQKRANLSTSPAPTDNETDGTIAATVDSPGDGFLALRSMPDSERGERITRIPHGAEIEINNCEKNRLTVSGRSGRWCQVEYAGRTGWVFDAWLDY